MTAPNDSAIRRAFELAGVDFIDERRRPGCKVAEAAPEKELDRKASLFETPPS